MSYLIHEDKAKYDTWFKVVLILPVAVIIFAFFSDFKTGDVGKYTVIGIVLLVGIIYWLVMPRRFYIMDDKIKLELGLNLSFSISYDRIETVRELHRSSFNINFATSNLTPIEIVMKKGMNINFSPENRELFIDKCNDAIVKWKAGTGQR